MEQILTSYDTLANREPTFWQQTRPDWRSDIDANCIYEGFIRLNRKPTSIYTKATLTTRYLYCFPDESKKDSNIPNRCVCISWKRIEPFTEAKNGIEIFGLRLARGSHCDIFLESAEELEIWLDKLNKFGIFIDVFDEYKQIELIGKGSNAKVFLVESQIDGEQYALKQIKASKIREQRASEQLQLELEVMRQVEHNTILKLYGVYQDAMHLYLILEYSACGDLYKRVSLRNKFTEDEVRQFAKILLEAVDFIHYKGYMHRDIKLENILVMSQNDLSDIRIADFGLSAPLTQTDMKKCGSPGYIAPEILRAPRYDQKVDIFSIGVILYILQFIHSITGQSPFYARNTTSILKLNTSCLIDFSHKR